MKTQIEKTKELIITCLRCNLEFETKSQEKYVLCSHCGKKTRNLSIINSLDNIELLESAMDYYSVEILDDIKCFIWKDEQGDLHRDGDSPAVIAFNGALHWYRHGLRHRDNDKPSIIYPDGTMVWYKEGLKHRDGDKPSIIYPDGTMFWYKGGLKHRDGDKPSIIYPDGTMVWYKEGLKHKILR